MRQQITGIEQAGGQIVAVTPARPAEAHKFILSRKLPFPLLSDPDLGFYRAYGLARADLRQELRSGTFATALGLTVQGYLPGKPAGDVRQLGGTFLVDRQGVLRYVHRDRATSDLPHINDLIEELKKLK